MREHPHPRQAVGAWPILPPSAPPGSPKAPGALPANAGLVPGRKALRAPAASLTLGKAGGVRCAPWSCLSVLWIRNRQLPSPSPATGRLPGSCSQLLSSKPARRLHQPVHPAWTGHRALWHHHTVGGHTGCSQGKGGDTKVPQRRFLRKETGVLCLHGHGPHGPPKDGGASPRHTGGSTQRNGVPASRKGALGLRLGVRVGRRHGLTETKAHFCFQQPPGPAKWTVECGGRGVTFDLKVRTLRPHKM